jgi:amino acid adenylation domain-containing protein
MEDVEDIYELAPMQHGLLFDSVTAGDSGMYLMQLEYSLQGELRLDDFSQAWQQTVDRHGMLRTSFHWEGMAKPLQVVHKSAELPLEQHDWSGLDAAARDEAAERFRQDDRARGVDFEAAPLMRLALFREGPTAWRLLWTFHHILMEGWSASLVLAEVLARYRSLRQGEPPVLAEHRPYGEFVAWFQQQDTARSQGYWRKELAGFQSPTHLGIDRSPSTVTTGSQFERASVSLSAADTEALQGFAKGNGLTLNTVFLGAWSVLLSRYAGEQDVLFGTMVSGRSAALPGVESIIGLFVNLLPTRVAVPPQAALLGWLRELQTRQARQREFEHSALVQVKSWSEVPAGLPLFESLLVFENWRGDLSATEWDTGLVVQDVVGDSREAGHPLTLVVAPGPELEIAVSFDTERFERPAIERLLANLELILRGMVAEPERALGSLPFLSDAEQALLSRFNDTAAPRGSTGWVHEQIAAQAVSQPDAPAIRFGESVQSYAELDARAERLAAVLRAHGIGRGSRVAVCIERSPDMIAALLATLKTGGAYVPLDPAYPAARLGYILESAGAAVLLTEAALADKLPEHDGTTLILEQLDGPGVPAENAAPAELSGEDLAYVIYTSGSTGKPKGVEVGHGALVNFLDSMRREPGLDAKDVLVAVTTLSFDIAGLELYLPLTTGAQVALASREQAGDGEQLMALLADSGATIMQATPATWRLLIQSGWTGNGQLTALCGGEALPYELAQDLRPRCRALWNLYGPTETTIWSTTGPVEVDTPLSVGKPIANTQVHVLDSDLARLPVGVTGEVYIGGSGLARGYSGRADLTAERFLPDPFSEVDGARVYWTGDLGRWRADGQLEILGRVDHQVKLRGFRIELGEIEVLLAEHAAVQENVVVIRTDNPDDKRLVAYVVCSEESFPGAAGLRGFLRDGLPEYMVPATYVRLDALPRTPNGKVDRNALPAPEGARPDLERGFLAPRNPLEERLAKIWQTVLGVERVGARDNFFDLGGHSLLLMPVISELKTELGIKLSPGDLVMPTLGQLAALCVERMLAAGLELPAGMQPGTGSGTEGADAAQLPPVGERMQPLYFGPSGDSLFGCYHPTNSPVGAPGLGVVLCQPHGHESIQFHRVFRQLAVLLSEAGLPTLRFDFHGCGDSEGDHEGWSLDRWRADVGTAIDELKQRSGCTRIVLLGMRLGGALAAQAALSRDDIDTMVLWDPVHSGPDYLAELRALQAKMTGYAHVIPDPSATTEEVLGFPLPAALSAELEGLDLLSLSACAARRVLVVESNASIAQDPLRSKLASLETSVELQRHSNPNLWVWVEDFGKMHVPREIIQAIVHWVGEEQA